MPSVLLNDLQERLGAGKVIVIAGSGVAAAATGGDASASWVGLIESGLKHVEGLPDFPQMRVEAARSLLLEEDPGSLILAAEALTESLGGRDSGEYGRWLRETIGSLQLRDPALPSAVANLGVPIATTNYDGLIEEASGWDRVTWEKPGRVQLALQGTERAVVHLHGHWQDPESVVLGVRSYEQVVNDGATQALQHAAAAMTSLLFVGVGNGGSDPNFRALREWLGKVLSGSQIRHYRLCLDSEVKQLSEEHKGEGIVPLAYGRGHSELTGFLESLGAGPGAKLLATTRIPSTQEPAVTGSLPGRPITMGRDDEISALALRLMSEPPPMLLLLGAPGIGKTNLTLAVLHDRDVVRKFGPRRWLVRCDATATASDLVTQLASVLDVPLSGDLRTAIQTRLSEAAGVLALDNVETPWESDTLAVEEFIGRLAGTGVTIIASLRGLERPAGVKWSAPVLLEPLEPESAKELFLSITSSAFDTPGLDDLLAEMGGIPLAIELLAHASEGEPDLQHLIDRWRKERTRLLKRKNADHKLLNVAVSIDLSWNSQAMTEPARRLLSMLSPLPNGIAEEDLEVLLPGEGISAANCLRRRGLAFTQADRLRALPPIRHHIADARFPSREDWSHLTTHYMQRAIDLGSLAGRAGGEEASKRLTSEAANITTAIEGALRARPDEFTFRAAGIYTRAACYVGIDARGPARAHVAAAEVTKDPYTIATSHECLGDIALQHSDHDSAREAYEQALPLYKQVDDALGETNCIKGLGDIALERSDYDSAREAYEQALTLYKQARNALGEANCIRRLGDIALHLSDYDSARKTYEQALPLYKQVDDALGEANCIQSLGEIALYLSDYDSARKAYEQALPLYKQVGAALGEANCILRLGNIAFQLSDHDTARASATQALVLYEGIGEPYSIGLAHYTLARAAKDPDMRCRHAVMARQAWSSIKRDDLIAGLIKELGECFVT